MAVIAVISLLASKIPYLLSVVLLYCFLTAVYRLRFSPIAHIPGPRFAALTTLYEFYHDFIHLGQFYFQIQKLHEEYGPIVRIGPQEVHIADSNFFDSIYNMTTKLHKDPWYYRFANLSQGSFGTVDSALHRLRRSAFAKQFSPAFIILLDSLINDHVGLLCRRVEELRQARKIVDLGNAYMSIAAGIVSDFVLPDTPNLLEDEQFSAGYHAAVRDFSILGVLNRHVSWLYPLLRVMPRWFVSITSPEPVLAVYDNRKRIEEQTHLVIQSAGAPLRDKAFPIVLSSIYHSNLPPHEKSHKRLCEDAFTLITAGSETMGLTMLTTTFHLLANPHIRAKLQTELREHFPDCENVISYRDLEKLPYLTACLKEGLRMSSAVSGRLPRINPNAPVHYQDYVLPAGTVISMTPRNIHYDPSIYPEPTIFRPERWLEDGEQARHKERYLVPFGKGARSCVGSSLAMAELFATLGNVFRRFPDMQLHETTLDDVAMAYDLFSSFAKFDSKGLKVSIPQADRL